MRRLDMFKIGKPRILNLNLFPETSAVQFFLPLSITNSIYRPGVRLESELVSCTFLDLGQNWMSKRNHLIQCSYKSEPRHSWVISLWVLNGYNITTGNTLEIPECRGEVDFVKNYFRHGFCDANKGGTFGHKLIDKTYQISQLLHPAWPQPC